MEREADTRAPAGQAPAAPGTATQAAPAAATPGGGARGDGAPSRPSPAGVPAGEADLRLTPAQEGLVLVALAEALRVAAAYGEARSGLARRLADELGAALGPPRPAHPALPALGTVVERRWIVGEADTAAALGHPDPDALVLASPRLALLFEIAASGALGAPAEGATHLGTGILVHHLGRAEIGEEVVVRAELVEASGRRGTFACSAESAGRLLALGVHQRVVVERAR